MLRRAEEETRAGVEGTDEENELEDDDDEENEEGG